MFRLSVAVALALLAAPVLAAPDVRSADAPASTPENAGVAPRMSQLIVFGNDPCPRSTGDEIVVCARLPENERYRVPKRFRDKRPADAPAPDTWSNRVAELEAVSRTGQPDSCSVVGSGGQTGCYQHFLRQFSAERRQQKAESADVP